MSTFIVLARILEPQDFGVVALAGVFIYSFNLVVGSSFADALVQRTNLAPEHTDTAFWSSVVMALTLTSVCYAGADYMAASLGEPKLAEVLPWLAWIMPLHVIAVVQTSLFRRALQFRVIMVRSLAGRTVGAIVGIGMAVTGYGVWSLVGQQLAGVLTTGIAMAIASTWRPRLRFSFARLRELFSFGFHVSASQTVNGMTEQAVNLLVGSLFGSVVLGYFNIAWRTVQLVRSLVGSAVYHVGFSAFSRLQDDRAAVARAVLQATRLSCLFGFPVGAGIALLAGPIILFMFGEKWDRSVTLLAILALEIPAAFYAIFFAACYRALNRPAWAFYLSLLYAGTGIAAVGLLAPFGIWAVAVTWVARAFLLLPMPMIMLQRILHVRMADVLAPAQTPTIATAIMSAAVAAFLWAVGDSMGSAALLATAIPIGVLTYAAVVAMLSPELAQVVVNTARIMISPSPEKEIRKAEPSASPTGVPTPARTVEPGVET